MQYLKGEKTNKNLRSLFSEKMGELSKLQSLSSTQKNVQIIELFNFGKGSFFGEERFLNKEEGGAPYTVVSDSCDGELFRISSMEFLKKIQIVRETARSIQKNSLKKKEKYLDKKVIGEPKEQEKESKSKRNHREEIKTQYYGTAEDIIKDAESQDKQFKLNKFLLGQKLELRDTLKEIVKGYPSLSKAA
mmetsp:Transcript_34496/g.33684  ORF Transcript_34496/g.33684 Transcript_34496/m.33684 type:complete len:190 (-) Transcript_34496:1104-1673(-)